MEEASERFLTPRRAASLAIVPGTFREIKRQGEKIFQNVDFLSQNADDGGFGEVGFLVKVDGKFVC